MAAFESEMLYVPENDTRGLNEFAQDILIQGKVQRYVPPSTPEDVRDSFECAVFSENDSDDQNSNAKKASKFSKKKFADKWDTFKNKKAARSEPLIDPNREQYDLIDKMLEERQKRYEEEERILAMMNSVPEDSE